MADLPPKVLSSLTATATTEQVVILLVVGGSICAVKNSKTCSFYGNDNGGICLVGKHMPLQTIVFPSEVNR